MIVELWGAGGGGGSCGGNIFCGNPGGGGGAGAYSRGVLTVTPLTNYFVTIGSGGAENSDGGSTQFNETGMGGTILMQAGGGRQGGDGGGFNNCYSTSPACGSGGAPDSTAPIGHTGASGSFLTNCAASGAAGFPIQGFPTTVGAGGSGVYTSLLKCTVTPQVTGQNGYAILTW